MPSHIDIHIGHWSEAITANLKAVEADRRYRAVFGEPKGLIVFYAAHNQHMLAYAAMMAGQRDLAVEHIRAMVKGMPREEVKEHATVAEAYIAVPYEVLVRFGRWDEILAEPDHPGVHGIHARVSPCGPGHCVCSKERRQVGARGTDCFS